MTIIISTPTRHSIINMQVIKLPSRERHDRKLLAYFTENEPRRFHLQVITLVNSPLINSCLLLIQQLRLQENENLLYIMHKLYHTSKYVDIIELPCRPQCLLLYQLHKLHSPQTLLRQPLCPD